jgi:polar amino acid transport system substrate-binding protein
MKKSLSLLVLVLLVGMFVFASSTLEDITKRGKIIVATDMTAVPMQYRDAEGNPTGFTVELMELAAEEMGVDIEWRDMAWESLIPSLLSGKVDMIAANMSMTLERCKSVRFSDPYFLTGIVCLARADSEFTSWEDLKAEGVKMGATMGSVHADFIEDNWGKDASLYENLAEWVTDLSIKRIDGVMDDEMILIEVSNKNPNLKVLDGYVRPDTYGLTFRQDQESDSLVKWFNWFIEWEKLTGKYGEIYEKYVGKEWTPNPIVD